MISEKTVELNLTAELLAWLYRITRRTHYVVAPSQRAEGKVGFDAGFYGNGPGILIQFKKAIVRGPVWCWQLNRTKLQDQHERLQKLEVAGFPVFYAFPFFHQVSEIALWRLQLLTKTFWVRPSALKPAGGPTGHHDLTLDPVKGTWLLSSPEPLEVRPETTLEQIFAAMQREWRPGAMEHFAAAVNPVLFGTPDDLADRSIEEAAVVDDLTIGLALVARAL